MMSLDDVGDDPESRTGTKGSTLDTARQGVSGSLGRRQFLTAAGAGGAALFAGCSSSETQSGETVTFLLLPTENPVEVKKAFRPALDYVEAEVDGVTMEVDVATDYSAVKPALTSGQADLALDDVTLLEDPDAYDVFGITVVAGAPKYYSFILTKSEYGIGSLEELEGETVAFADRLSTSGSLFPLAALSRAGLDVGAAPDGEPADFTGQWSNHTEARNSLINRDEVVACGTSVGRAIEYVEGDSLPDRVREKTFFDSAATEEPLLDILHVSDPIPENPIIARGDWESENRDPVQQAFLDMTPEDVREYAEIDMNQVEISAVEEGTVEDYQVVLDTMSELGVEPGR